MRPDLMTPTRRALVAGAAASFAGSLPAIAAPGPDGEWTSFDDSDGLIRFKGAVNGHPVDLTLDSGAGRVVIDQAFAEKIGLGSVNANGVLQGLSESRPGSLSEALTIDLGEGDLRLSNAVIADLSAVKAGGYDAPVLIGRDIFEVVSVDIDFVGKRIAFRQRGSFETSAFRRVPLRQRLDTRQIEVAIEGRRPTWAIVDLGSGSPLAMSKAYATSIGLYDGRPTSVWLGSGVDGIVNYDVGRASWITVAGVAMRDVPFDAYPVWNRATTAQVNIGYPLMQRLGRVIVDYASNTLFVSKTPPAPAPFNRNRIGLALLPLDAGYRVIFVAPGSPGERDGWKAGDVIAAINGKPTLSSAERAALGGSARIAYTMADGSVRALVPADYY
jgi:hypothetical protein